MFQACRPMGRLFYWVLAVVVTASSVRGLAHEEHYAGKPGEAASLPTAKPAAAELCRAWLRRLPKGQL
jgi:hypothetical protein